MARAVASLAMEGFKDFVGDGIVVVVDWLGRFDGGTVVGG